MFPTLRVLSNVVSAPFKRAQLGLFHGKMRQSGNSIPFSKHKSRRSWLPNVQSKRYFSDVLQQYLRVKVTTRAMKTIEKHGGIDKYVLKTKADLLGWEGMRIRIMVKEAQAKLAREAKTPLIQKAGPTAGAETTPEIVTGVTATL